MQLFNKFADLPEFYKGCVVALGTFDGIHLGHVGIVDTAVSYAQSHNIKSVVFSFSNHPLDLLAPERAPSRLCSESRKKQLLGKLAVDALFHMRFDKNFAALSSAQFIFDLKRHFNPACIVVGDNYSYGYLGAGTADTLLRDGDKYGFEVIVRQLVKVDGIVASSTNIRHYIIAGNIAAANKLLGRAYSLAGRVVAGDARGRTLGFPTANLKISPKNLAIPPDGGYLAIAKVGGKAYKSVVSIGTNPTFAGKERRIEAYLLDFSADIYGKQLEVAFLEKIRDVKKFANVEELIATIAHDVEYARRTINLPAASYLRAAHLAPLSAFGCAQKT